VRWWRLVLDRATTCPTIPSDIDVVYAVEPSSLAVKLADKRMKSAFVSIQLIGLEGQAIPLANESCDAAVVDFYVVHRAQSRVSPARALGAC